MSDRPKPRFVSERRDGRFATTAGFLHACFKAHPPKLAFRETMTRRELGVWRRSVRRRLKELIREPEGPPQPEPRCLWTRRRDGYELQKWEAYPEPLSVVPFLVLVPEGAGEHSRRPAVLCLPGSGYTKESLAGEPELAGPPTGVPGHDAMALWYARQGMVAAAVDNPGIGETADPALGPDEMSPYLAWIGRSYEALSVTQRLPIARWLKRQPGVDPERIAVSGHSLGAKAALILGLLDDSLAAVVWNDSVVSWRECAVACDLQAAFVSRQFIPGLMEWFDYPDLMAALAPRPLLICEGGRARDIERVRGAYRLAGAESHLEVTHYPRYATPAQRPLDDVEMPEGLTAEEYWRYANVDPPGHWFKEDVAVPWLARVLRYR